MSVLLLIASFLLLIFSMAQQQVNVAVLALEVLLLSLVSYGEKWYSPRGIFAIAWVALFIVPPLFSVGVPQAILYANIFSGISLTIITLMLIFFKPSKRKYDLNFPGNLELKFLSIISVTVGIIGYIILLFVAGGYTPVDAFQDMKNIRHLLSSGWPAYISRILFPFILIGIAGIYVCDTKKYGGNVRLYFVFLISFAAFLILTTGSRGLLVQLILSLVILRSALFGLSKFKMLFIGSFMILFMAIYGVVRVKENISLNIILSAISNELSLSFVFYSALNRLNAYWVFTNILSANNELPVIYGASYIMPFFRFIPRDLWEDKPLETGAYVTALLWPSVADDKVSFAASFLGEGYLNFLYAGPIISSFLVGLFILFSDNFWRKNILLYAIFYPVAIFSILSNGFDGGVVVNLLMAFPAIMFLFLKLKRL